LRKPEKAITIGRIGSQPHERHIAALVQAGFMPDCAFISTPMLRLRATELVLL
jgi:hypothetical protein